MGAAPSAKALPERLTPSRSPYLLSKGWFHGIGLKQEDKPMPVQISIIIPAFKAENLLPRALSSIAQQDLLIPSRHPTAPSLDPSAIEVIIAADDQGDYHGAGRHLPPLMKVKIIPPIRGAAGSGPGATRNRGILAASGDYLAFLDADDAWSPGYLSALWPLAKRYGAAFAATSVITPDGQCLLTLGQGIGRPDGEGPDKASMDSAGPDAAQPPAIQQEPPLHQITPSYFGIWPGSFHPLVRRDLSPGFEDGAGQDVFHALAVLGAVGGRAPFVRGAPYHLHITAGSVTTSPAFTRRIDTRYRDHLRQLQHHHRPNNPDTALSGMARLQAMQALSRRRYWNNIFSRQGGHPLGFYGFFGQKRKIIP